MADTVVSNGPSKDFITPIWNQFAHSIKISIVDFLSTVAVAAFLRRAIDYKIHWARLLVLTWFLSIGGSTLVALLANKEPRWFTQAPIANGILLGYLCMFHCPGDLFYKAFNYAPLQAVWPIVKAVGAALGVSSFGIERLVRTDDTSKNIIWPTLFIAGVLAGYGGSFVAELSNLLLLPKQQYQTPRFGASGGFVQAVVLTATYLFFLRDVSDTSSAGMENAVAGLVLVALALSWFPRFNEYFHAALSTFPGWNNVVVPTNMSDNTKVSEEGLLRVDNIFGYEPLADPDRELFLSTEDALTRLLLDGSDDDSGMSSGSGSSSEDDEGDEELIVEEILVAPSKASITADAQSPQKTRGKTPKASRGVGRQTPAKHDNSAAKEPKAPSTASKRAASPAKAAKRVTRSTKTRA